MARFCGRVGYGETVNVGGGNHKPVITERIHFGDVIRNSRNIEIGEKVNNDFTVSNSISIVADEYANTHFSAIRYVEWSGTLWQVTGVEQQSPRLILRLGGKYNGETA